MQSKRDSLKESLLNVVVGLIIAIISQVTFFKFMSIPIRLDQNIYLALFMTVVSILRSYCLRRFFNRKTNKSVKRGSNV